MLRHANRVLNECRIQNTEANWAVDKKICDNIRIYVLTGFKFCCQKGVVHTLFLMCFVQTNSGVMNIANLSLQLESLETKFPTKFETSVSTVNKHQNTTVRKGHLKTPRYSSGSQQLHRESCCQTFNFSLL